MNKKIILLTLVSVFLLSATIVTSSAQTRIVGVSEGNWFKYGEITVNWSSNDPNATFPPPGYEGWEELNETEWMLMTVADVYGTNITIQTVQRFKNGTEKTESGDIDITGDGNMTIWAISANLDAGDTVYASEAYSEWRINETIVRTYPDSVRDTNHLNMTVEQSETDYYYYNSMSFYWDKPTGIIVEIYYDWINQTGEYLTTWSMLFRITESNVWVVPEFPTWTSILLVFIVITTAIGLYKRRILKALIQ